MLSIKKSITYATLIFISSIQIIIAQTITNDAVICTNTATISAGTPTDGTGLWTCNRTEVVINSSGEFETQVSELQNGANVFTWAFTNTSGVTTQKSFTISYYPVKATAGSDVEVCSDIASLTATPPVYGTGQWILASGGGVIADKTAYTSQVSELRTGTNIFRWVVTNNDCSAYDNLKVTNNTTSSPATMADATLCENSTELIAQPPDIGTGTWSVENGDGTIANAANAVTEITNLSKGENIVRWTITKGICSVYKDVVLTNNSTEANAGDDQTLCEDETTLFATKPATATGKWTIASGSAYFSDVNATNPNITKLATGSNTFRWTVSENNCTATDEVVINSNMPSPALVSQGDFICTNNADLKATAPHTGNGKWSIVAGGGTITNPDANITTVTNMNRGDNTFRWTVTYNGCTSYADVEYTNNTVFSKTSDNQVICVNYSSISAQYTDGASGKWTLTSGYATIANVNSPQTNVSNLSSGNNVFRWTVTGDGCTDYSDVVITNNLPTTASVMPNVYVCVPQVQLYGNQPLQGNGEWSFESGSGDFNDAENNNTIATNLATGENTIRWTITKGECTSYDEVVVNNKHVPANAGPDQSLCGTKTDLNANQPISGASGTWSVVSGRGVFSDANQYNARVISMLPGLNTFRWTVSKEECTSFDDVMVTNNQITAYAGDDKEECANNSFISATVVTSGVGYWTVVSGGATIENSLSNVTNVYNMGAGENIFLWTVENNGCTATDELLVFNFAVNAYAGEDKVICSDTEINLNASNVTNGTGKWSIQGGNVTFADINNPKTLISNISSGSNTLRWSASNNYCSGYDDVVISNNEFYVYLPGNKVACGGTYELSAPDPGSFATGVWTVENSPAVIENPTLKKTTVTGLKRGENIFRWTVSKSGCTDSKTVTVMNNFYDAYAGTDAKVCENKHQLNGSLSEEAKNAGVSGKWSILSGGANFSPPEGMQTTRPDTLENPVVTNMIQGRNIFRWIISLENADGTCTDYDDVEITNNTAPAHAGKDQVICLSEVFLNAGIPIEDASGFWSIAEGSNLIIENSLNPYSKISNLQKGENKLIWTVDYKNCRSRDTLTITNNSFTVETGELQEVLNSTATATITASELPEEASGEWTVISGKGDFSCGTKKQPTTQVCDLGIGQNIYRWSVNWKNCSAYADAIVVYISPDMLAKVYKREMNTCKDSMEVAAQPPLIGAKKWISYNNDIWFKNDTLSTTWVYNLQRGKNVIYWTVEKNNIITTDSIVIHNNSFDINAGNGEQTCDVPYQLNAEAAEDEEYIETEGEWIGIGSFSNINDHNATIRGLWAGENELLWRVKRRKCPTCEICMAADTVVIYYTPPQDMAETVYNEVISCDSTAEISAYKPLNSTGEWSVIKGTGTIENPDENTTKVANLSAGNNVFRWTLRDKNCTTYDTVEVAVNPVTATANITHLDCNDNPIGQIQLIPEGGNGNIEYELGRHTGFKNNNGLFTDLDAGIYDIWAIDEYYCLSYLGEFEVKPQGGLKITDVKFLGLEENDASKAKIELVAGNGQTPYTYQVGSVIQNNPVFTDVPLGIIHVWIEDANGCRIYNYFEVKNNTVGIDEPQKTSATSLLTISPNPVENQSEIKFYNPNSGSVEIELYDLLGRKHETLVDDVFPAGNYSFLWKNTNQKAGVYLLKMTNSSQTVTSTFIISK